MARTNDGTTWQGREMAYLVNNVAANSMFGSATAVGATTLTDTTKTWVGSSATAGAAVLGFQDMTVVCNPVNGLNCTYGTIISNTGTILTIDRWMNPNNPFGTSAATTPSAGVSYTILPMSIGPVVMAFSSVTGIAATDTPTSGWSSELQSNAAGTGLNRKISDSISYSYPASNYTVSRGPITVAAGDLGAATSVSVFKFGMFTSMVLAASGSRLFVDDNITTAVLQSGDSFTCSDQINY
jgi:hypothetical protein